MFSFISRCRWVGEMLSRGAMIDHFTLSKQTVRQPRQVSIGGEVIRAMRYRKLCQWNELI